WTGFQAHRRTGAGGSRATDRRGTGRAVRSGLLPAPSRCDLRAPRPRTRGLITLPGWRARGGWGIVTAILTTSLRLPLHSRGKVRATYRPSERELLVQTSHRLSARASRRPAPRP